MNHLYFRIPLQARFFAASFLLATTCAHSQPAPVPHPSQPADPYLEAYEACYRSGRCDASDLRQLREFVQRVERTAPRAPQDSAKPTPVRQRMVEPTAENQIRPEFRGASQVRDEFRKPPENQ